MSRFRTLGPFGPCEASLHECGVFGGGTLGYFGPLRGILGYFVALWGTLGNFGPPWATMRYFGALWGTLGSVGGILVPFGVLQDTLGCFGPVGHT